MTRKEWALTIAVVIGLIFCAIEWRVAAAWGG